MVETIWSLRPGFVRGKTIGGKMEKTKANFRAMREACGMSQADVACEADVSVLSVKKWENPSSDIKQPPQDVWDWLVMAYDGMVMDAREAVEQIMAARTGQTVALPYFRTQDELDAVQLAQGIDEPVGYHNARMRMIAQMLSEREVPYEFVYPEL